MHTELLRFIRDARRVPRRYGRNISDEGVTLSEIEFEADFADQVEPILVDLYDTAVAGIKEPLPDDTESLVAQIVAIITGSAAALALLALLRKMLVRAYEIGGAIALAEMGIDGEFALTDQGMIDRIYEYADEVQQTLITTTANDMAKQIDNGRSKGVGLAAILAALASFIELRAAFRAFLIAMNESVSGSRWGMEDAYRRNGIIEVEFRTQRDENVDQGDPLGPCAIQDGKVFDIWNIPQEARIPLHFGCVLGETEVSYIGNLIGATKRWATGKIVVIETARGNRLSVTPNHPILTDLGWVAAGKIKVGNNVVCGYVSDGKLVSDQNAQDKPATAEDVVNSFLESSQVRSVEMPVSPKDFHGDGGDSEIAVVGTNGLLLSDENASLVQDVLKGDFAFSDPVSGQGSLNGVRKLLPLTPSWPSSARSLISGANNSLSFGFAHGPHANDIGLADIAEGAPSGFHSIRNGFSGNSEPLGQGENGLPVSVESSDFPLINMHRLRAAGDFNVAGDKYPADDLAGDAELARKISDGHFGEIFLDDVISVEICDFSGHVYNLHTEHNFYVASGIVTHNCRCYYVPILFGWELPLVVWRG